MAAVAHKILLFLKIFCGFFHSIVEFFSTKRKSVADKVVVITGAARGIGKEMALLFAALNAKVVVLDIDEVRTVCNVAYILVSLRLQTRLVADFQVENRKTADAITKAGGRAYAQECDVANPEVMKKVAQSLLHHPEIGIPDILICNAGVLIPNLFCEQSDVDIKKTMDINLLGFFWTLRAFLPHMIRNGSGHIVAMASTASFYGLPSSTSYT
ncbi:unnamed protein product [Soboliphyme baturini]|uniref:Hydroxysteroid 17-beta dehydrogenase 11 n=1 Tax=Soboliphyme baturini TaxID=241478 RepID=A0A183ID96_9BILA|nr:unnamed protein product [Soboliphyme baturini]